MTDDQDRESERKFSEWMAQTAPVDLHDAHAQAWFGIAFEAWEAADGPKAEIELLEQELKSKDCEHDSDRRVRVTDRIKDREREYTALVAMAQGVNAADAPSQTATPAPVTASTAKPNKSEKTLIFEAKVLELLTKFWNDRTSGTEPTKGDLCKLVYAEILRTPVRGARKTTLSMVNDVARNWKMPIVLPAMVPDSKYNEKRHPFKGER